MLDPTNARKPMRLLTTLVILLGGLAQQAGCAPTSGPAANAKAAASPAPAPAAEPAPAQPSDVAGLRSERIAIHFSDADQVASALIDMLAIHESTSDGSIRALLVDHDTNELVVVGTDSGIARVRAILSPAITEQGADVMLLPLDHARAEDVARSIERLGPPGVVVIPDHATNSVVVRASGQAHERIAALVEEMDSPAAPR